MSEFDTLQTLFLGLLSVFGGIATTFGMFILRKLDCFNSMFNGHAERISKLEKSDEIHHS